MVANDGTRGLRSAAQRSWYPIVQHLFRRRASGHRDVVERQACLVRGRLQVLELRFAAPATARERDHLHPDVSVEYPNRADLAWKGPTLDRDPAYPNCTRLGEQAFLQPRHGSRRRQDLDPEAGANMRLVRYNFVAPLREAGAPVTSAPDANVAAR